MKLIQKYGFIRKIEPFHLRMKHNIIQMNATYPIRSTQFSSTFSIV